MKQRLAILMIMLVLLLPLTVGFALPRQQASLTLDVSAGYGGVYRRGQWTPVRISVSNSGANLDGFVRVRLGELGGLEETTYRTPIDLPRGSRKQVFLYISLEDFAQEIDVEIVNTDGHVVVQQTSTLRMANIGDTLIAVITESVYGAVDLTARDIGNGDARQVNWRVEDLPPLSDALVGLDAILFHEVDTGALRPEQIEALEQWVLSGGHLIVAGGEAWQRTTSQLAGLLPVRLRGSVPLTTATAFGRYVSRGTGVLDEQMTATDSMPDDHARVMLAHGGLPLIVRGAYGSGWVDFLAVDPNAEPLRSWIGTADLWYTLLTSTGQQPSWANGFSSWATARDATLTTANTVLPTFLQLCGFLAAYVVLVGPVNYLILKRFNRREWAWITIPVLIAVFSILAYQVGFNLRGNVPVVNRLTVVRVWPGREQAQMQSLVGVQSPRRMYYDIAAADGYALRPLPQSGIGINVPVLVNEGTQYVAENILVDGGTVASLVASGYAAAPILDAAAEWHLSANVPPRVTGTVNNTSGITLDDAVVVINGGAYELGTLRPGASATFDLTSDAEGPGPLTLGTTFNWSRAYAYAPYSTRSSYGGCFVHNSLPLTVPQVMQGEPFACSASSVTNHQHEIRQRYRLLAALVRDQEDSGGRGSNAYLFAWSREAVSSVELVDRTATTEDTTLYVFNLPVSVAPVEGRVEVPPGLTSWTVADLDDPATMSEISPELSFQIDDAGQAVFQFMPLPLMHLDRVDVLTVHVEGQGGVVVELWNWQTELWEPVTIDQATDRAIVRRPDVYVGPEEAVKVRLTSPNALSYNRVQHVRIGYRGWLERAAEASE